MKACEMVVRYVQRFNGRELWHAYTDPNHWASGYCGAGNSAMNAIKDLQRYISKGEMKGLI